MQEDEYAKFLGERTKLIANAIGLMSTDSVTRSNLTVLQAEIDSMRAIEVAPGRVVAELNVLLSERVAALSHWLKLLEQQTNALKQASDDRRGGKL